MTASLARALAAVLHDFDAVGAALPAIEPSDWQNWPTAESAMLRAADGSGQGVWVDTARTPAEQLAMVAEQFQEWALEELCARGRPTNWPRCPEHPANHPLDAVVSGRVAVWACPGSGRPAHEVGRLPTDSATR